MTETSSPPHRDWPTAQAPEIRLVSGARHRLLGKLDVGLDEVPPDPTLAEIVEAARPWTQASGWMLTGGEPTLRADLPKLVRALSEAGAPRLGLVTDGLALAAPKVPTMLAELGLKRVRIILAGARADAHDWLVGHKGAWKRAVRAVQACVAAGLEVEIECPVSRPTSPHLEEGVELFEHLGAGTVLLRRITARGAAAADDVAVVARLGLSQPHLERAVQAGVRRGLRMGIEGFPVCVVPAARNHVLAQDAVRWVLPDASAWRFLSTRFEPPSADHGCARCPGKPACCQAPVDYVRRFGRTEIDSESAAPVRVGRLPPTPLSGGDVRPPARAGRSPGTRLMPVRVAARMSSLSGDPLVALRAAAPPSTIRVLFLAPSRMVPAHLGDHPGPAEAESTRAVRVRLVKAAQEGAAVLRVASAGSLAHPNAADLLRETTRLELRRIEVAGEASSLDGFSDTQLRRLRGIHRLDVALFGPDAETHDQAIGVPGAFEATLRAVERLGGLAPSIEIGAYAVLDSHEHLQAFAEAWDFGDLPGTPWFRLSPRGGCLTLLAEAAASLEPGPARDAIAAVLPVSLLARADVVPAPEATIAWGDIPTAFSAPSGSDRFGCYTDRPSTQDLPPAGSCPGFAVGWTVQADGL